MGLEVSEGADDEGAVGPGAGEGNVEVEAGGARVPAVAVGDGGKGTGGAGVRAGGVRGGKLAHHQVPGGGPGRSDGGDEGPRWEGPAPEEAADGGEGIGGGGRGRHPKTAERVAFGNPARAAGQRECRSKEGGGGGS